MEKITIKRQGSNIEMEISKSTTAYTILDGMVIYINSISQMTGVPIKQVLEDLTKRMLKDLEEDKK